MFRCLGPSQKALIKMSSLGGWKVGYQFHCRSSMGPTRLHLVNTFRPFLAQIRPLLPKATLGLPSILNTFLSSTFSLILYHFLYQFNFTLNTILLLLFWNFVMLFFIHSTLSFNPFHPLSIPLCHLLYIIDEQQEQRWGLFWPNHGNT